MNLPEERIVKFIKKHHVLTLATSSENIPYCANCFYVYLEDMNSIVFTSDYTTKHISDTKNQSFVAGSIVLETKIIGKIQGIQFCGTISEAKDEILKKARKAYLLRFPFAIISETALWIVELNFIKMTDNRLGFGKKLIWKKSES